jgi:hypothetical protein
VALSLSRITAGCRRLTGGLLCAVRTFLPAESGTIARVCSSAKIHRGFHGFRYDWYDFIIADFIDLNMIGMILTAHINHIQIRVISDQGIFQSPHTQTSDRID